MGAVTALLYADEDNMVDAMVLDSPFASLKLLAEELVERATEQTSTKIPKFAVSGMLQIVRRTIRSRAKIDINDISAIDHTPKLYVPALFCVVKGDSFIANKHSELLHGVLRGRQVHPVGRGRPQRRAAAGDARLCEAVPGAVHAGADVLGAREARERF